MVYRNSLLENGNNLKPNNMKIEIELEEVERMRSQIEYLGSEINKLNESLSELNENELHRKYKSASMKMTREYLNHILKKVGFINSEFITSWTYDDIFTRDGEIKQDIEFNISVSILENCAKAFVQVVNNNKQTQQSKSMFSKFLSEA
jgi:hypothetical protein